MSIEETPNVTRAYCPACEPEADPIKELLEVTYCNLQGHRPAFNGDADTPVEWIGSAGEAGGEPNRLLCNALHRKGAA